MNKIVSPWIDYEKLMSIRTGTNECTIVRVYHYWTDFNIWLTVESGASGVGFRLIKTVDSMKEAKRVADIELLSRGYSIIDDIEQWNRYRVLV